MKNLTEPSLHDETWRAFILEKEKNSVRANKQWPQYRNGLRRLEERFSSRLPRAWIRRALAEDAFFCATHWKHSARVVRRALKELIKQPIDTKIFVAAAAEFWLWAWKTSRPDLEDAEALVRRARVAIEEQPLDEMSRKNLRRMMVAVVDQHRAA